MKMLSMWIAFLGVSVLSAPTGAETKTTRVLVWDERQPAQLEAYDNYLGNAIAEHLGKNPALEVTSLHLDAPSQGLSNEILEKTDVLVLWSHIRKSEVSQESGQRVARRIQQGKLSLVALHSSHWASPFVEAMNLRAQADARKKFKARPGQMIGNSRRSTRFVAVASCCVERTTRPKKCCSAACRRCARNMTMSARPFSRHSAGWLISMRGGEDRTRLRAGAPARAEQIDGMIVTRSC